MWVVALIILLIFTVIAIALPIALVKGKEGTTGRKGKYIYKFRRSSNTLPPEKNNDIMIKENLSLF